MLNMELHDHAHAHQSSVKIKPTEIVESGCNYNSTPSRVEAAKQAGDRVMTTGYALDGTTRAGHRVFAC